MRYADENEIHLWYHPFIWKYIFFILDLEFTAREGEWFVPNGGRIHREDVARYLLRTAKEHSHSSKIVAISTKQ